MRSAIIRFPGASRERELQAAAGRLFGKAPSLVWHKDSALPELDLILLPGGLSFGGYLRPGAIAARAPIMREVKRQAEKGVAVIGICNGFQILTEAGLLPGALLRNQNLKFVCRDVHLRVETDQAPFLHRYRKGDELRMPVAHYDGNYFAEEALLKQLEDQDRVAFRYAAGPDGNRASANPNGSARDIAGILSENRRVLGMMAHPEAATEPFHGSTDGCGLFRAMAEALS